MKLSLNFTLNEFDDSDTAQRLNIDNGLPIDLVAEAKRTADMMERIREYLSYQAGKPIPINITSGYRCIALNRAIGSADTSDHIKAMAVDFKAAAFGTPLEVCKALVPHMGVLGIGQLIYEKTWAHCSSRTPDKLINSVLTLQDKGYVTGIVES